MSSRNVQELCERLLANDKSLAWLYLDGDEFDDKDWRLLFDAVKNSQVIETLSVKLAKLMSWGFMQGLVEAVWNHPTMEGICFRQVESFEQLGALAVAFKMNKNLRHVEFEDCWITPEVHAFLKEILTANAIESLSLLDPVRSSDTDDGLGFSDLDKAFQETSGLKNLHVSLDNKVSRAFLRQVPYIIQLNESLESLTFEPPADKPHITARVVQAATGHKSLKHFKCGFIDIDPLDEDSVSAIGIMTCRSPFLEELHLEFIHLQPEGARRLAAGLACRDCNIQKLCLICCGIEDEEAQIITGALSTNGTVTELDLSENEIGDDGAIAVGSMLETNNTIETFRLSYDNEIRHEGALALVNALRTNTGVRDFCLQDNIIGDAAAGRFAEVLAEQNSTVERFSLSGFGADGLMEFIRHLPNMQSVVELILCTARLPQHEKPAIIDALVGAIEQNTNMQRFRLHVDGRTEKLDRIEYLLDLNRGGRRIVESREGAPVYQLPLNLWPLVLGRDDCSNDSTFYLLCRKNDVIMSMATDDI